MKVVTKIPAWQEILPVFSLILFIVYSFTIFRMLFQIPSWMYSHTKTDVLLLAVYVFAAALIESLLVLLFILAANLLLPGKIFRDKFIAQGSILVLGCTTWALVLKYYIDIFSLRGLRDVSLLVFLFVISLIFSLVISSMLLNRYQRVKTILEELSDRMIVFAWIYVPVGVLSTVIVLVRRFL